MIRRPEKTLNYIHMSNHRLNTISLSDMQANHSDICLDIHPITITAAALGHRLVGSPVHSQSHAATNVGPQNLNTASTRQSRKSWV